MMILMSLLKDVELIDFERLNERCRHSPVTQTCKIIHKPCQYEPL